MLFFKYNCSYVQKNGQCIESLPRSRDEDGLLPRRYVEKMSRIEGNSDIF